jgi:hypothetical protein
VAAHKGVEDGGEFLCEDEKPAVGGWLLIAQSMDDATGCRARGGYAGGEPGVIHFREEVGDLGPTGALAGFAGVAHEHEVKIQRVAGGSDEAVRSTADYVAEDG